MTAGTAYKQVTRPRSGLRTSAIPWLLTGATVLYLILAIAASWTRAPIGDEVFYASAAYNLVTHGFMGTTVHETAGVPFPGLERRTYTHPPLHILVQAAWYKVIGFGFRQMRLNSTLWGLLLLASWYIIMRKLADDALPAVIAVGLLAVDYTVLMTASLGRMSMMAAALQFAAIAAYLHWREWHLDRALFAANAFAVLSGLTHPLGGVLAVVNLVVAVLYLDARRLRWAHIGYVGVPYIIGAIGWGIYILQDPRMFWAQFSASATQGKRLTGLANPFAALLREVSERYLVYFGFGATKDPRILLLASYVVALFAAALTVSRARHRNYRLLIWLTIANFLAMTMIEGTKQRVYLIHSVPYLVVWAAIALYLARERWGTRTFLILGTIFAGLHVGAVGWRVHLNPYANEYLPVIEYLRPITDRSELVIGPARLLFGLGFDSNYIFDGRLGLHSGKVPPFIVLDQDFRSFLAAQAAVAPDIGAGVSRIVQRYRRVWTSGEYEVYTLADPAIKPQPPRSPGQPSSLQRSN